MPEFKHGFDKHGCISNWQLRPVVPGKHVSQFGPVKLPTHLPFFDIIFFIKI